MPNTREFFEDTVPAPEVVALRLIHDKRELDGTAYVELLPGRFNGECWIEGSLFIAEDAFEYVEPIVARHVPSYDHYEVTDVDSGTWGRIVHDLKMASQRLESVRSDAQLEDVLGLPKRHTRTGSDALLKAKAAQIGKLLNDLCCWLLNQTRVREGVAIIGL
jgi:hypothetical protein